MTNIHLAAKNEDIAETVLLPGDPLRAKYIAETFLEDHFCFNEIRGMYGYSGYYNGKMVSVQATGMGIPSTLIYLQELANCGAKNLIRVGTFGSIQPEIQLGQVAVAMGACSDSSIQKKVFGQSVFAPICDFELLEKCVSKSKELGISIKVGNIFSSDNFYNPVPDWWKVWADHGVMGAEMESYAIYQFAARNKLKGLSILTASDHIIEGTMTSSQQREKSFTDMMKLALEIA